MITLLLESSQNHRTCTSSRNSTKFIKTLTLNDVMTMVAFQFSIIKHLTQYYANWVLNNLTQETYNPQMRLVRALYRFQLHFNLFGVSNFTQMLEFRNMDVLRIFFCIYEPWEVEEIACVYTFTRTVVDQVCKNIRFEGQYPRGLLILIPKVSPYSFIIVYPQSITSKQ